MLTVALHGPRNTPFFFCYWGIERRMHEVLSLIPLTFLCDNISKNFPCSDSVLQNILESSIAPASFLIQT